MLLLSYLDNLGLSVTVEAEQALAVLYSKGRLYKGPSLAGLSQHLRVDTESRPQQHTWNSEFFVLSRSK